MAAAASFLFIISAVLDFLIAISIPFLPTTNFSIVVINFSNETNFEASAAIFGNNTGSETVFNGQVNSENVQNLIDLNLGLWAACFDVAQGSISNSTCFSPSFGYTVTMEQSPSSSTFTVVQSAWTTPLFVEVLAGIVTTATIFTQKHARHHWITAAAVVLTTLTLIFEIVLLNNVSKITPVFGSQVKTQPGPGFGLTLVSLGALLVGVFVHHVQKS